MSDLPSTSSSSLGHGLSSGVEEGVPGAKRQRTLGKNWKLIDSQRSFKEEWRKQFLVIPHPISNSQCLCLVCRTVFTQLKTHTIKRHFESKHKSLTELSADAKASRYERLFAAYEKEAVLWHQQILEESSCLLHINWHGSSAKKSTLFRLLKISWSLLG